MISMGHRLLIFLSSSKRGAFFRQGKSDPLHSKVLTPSGVRLEIGNWKFGRLDIYKLVEELSDMVWRDFDK